MYGGAPPAELGSLGGLSDRPRSQSADPRPRHRVLGIVKTPAWSMGRRARRLDLDL